MNSHHIRHGITDARHLGTTTIGASHGLRANNRIVARSDEMHCDVGT